MRLKRMRPALIVSEDLQSMTTERNLTPRCAAKGGSHIFMKGTVSLGPLITAGAEPR